MSPFDGEHHVSNGFGKRRRTASAATKLLAACALSVLVVGGHAFAETSARKQGTSAKPVRTAAKQALTPRLRSGSVAVVDLQSGQVLYQKNADEVTPIASITKLMTAMVVLDSAAALGEELTVTREDVDRVKGSRSRLPVGARLTREDALLVALMASENRAASALARHYPGGEPAFVAAMNAKAGVLGLTATHFADATGLSSANVSTAADLVKLVTEAHRYPLIREFSTTASAPLQIGKRSVRFGNTNSLVRSRQWEISLSKTGYIREAGKCLVMQTWVDGRPVAMVLLDSYGKLTRLGDANRLRDWMRRQIAKDRLSEFSS